MATRRRISLVDDWLIDDALDAYVCWRERRTAVRETYERWSAARVVDAPNEFAAHQSALDREERAASRYADVIAELTNSLAPDA